MRKPARLFLALAVVALAFGQQPVIRSDHWRVIGPGGGGAQFLPTISPHDPNRVLVACDMTGSYISNDAGASWRMFNLRGRVRFFVFDPLDPNVIYAQASGLWRSVDSGQSWELVHPDPTTLERVDMADDHAGERIVSRGGLQGTITALAVDPADSSILYAVVRDSGSAFQESSDRGRTWKKTAELSGGTRIYVDPSSPRQERTIFVVGAAGVSVRDRGVWTQGTLPTGATAFVDVTGGFTAEGGKPTFYGISGHGIWASLDGGSSWTRCSFPADSAEFQAVATSLGFPNTVYVSYSRLRSGNEQYFGVARSSNFGRNWDLVWKESRNRAENIHDAWITDRFGPGWGENPLNLGVSPADPNLCYGTDYGRTMRTVDGGRNWKATYASRLPDGSTTTSGMDVTTCYGVHFDPFEKDRVFISYTDIGLFRSENRGRSWFSSTDGVPPKWVNTTYWVVFDPDVRGRAWGVMSGVHDLPRPKMWRQRQPATFDGGVCISQDGGRTWQRSTEGMPESAATHILLDQSSPRNERILYVAAFGRGVFKSVDGGKKWVLMNSGIEGPEPFAWRLALDSRGALYLVVARRSEDGRIGDAADGALYRSENGARSWTRLKLPEGVNGPNGLSVDPGNPEHLYLAAWGRNVPTRDSGGGVFVSTDRGATWRCALSRDRHIYDVTIDSRDPNIVYACGFESSAWRSEDRGTTWKRIKGYNFKWGHRVIPDPSDARRIYITTFGGSVWLGPAIGDPSALEDLVTPLPAR